jgi:ornithine carbamoyltransferase
MHRASGLTPRRGAAALELFLDDKRCKRERAEFQERGSGSAKEKAMSGLKGRSFCGVLDLSAQELELVLDTAEHLKTLAKARGVHRPLEGRVLGMIFQKPSLRTRVSFEVAMQSLGGHAIYLAPEDISIGKRESTADVATVLGRYVDAIMARVFGHDIVLELARHAGVPVINGLSDHEHPCQIVGDLQTVRERLGGLRGVQMAYVGDGNNVASSLLYGAARTGMHLRIASPKGYEPAEEVIETARREAQGTGARLEVLDSPEDAVRDADAVYTDVWTSMGQEAERQKRLLDFQGYRVDRALLERAHKGAIVLHCLPAHYGEEITEEVTRGASSAVWDQAENRLHAQKALLNLLVS